MISGNGGDGVIISGTEATGNGIIGTDANGSSALGNSRSGVFIAATRNKVKGNKIRNYVEDDVLVSVGTGNSILSNRIFTNGDFGIDLGLNNGVTNLINSDPNQSFTIQCFLAGSDPSKHGEGRTFLDADTIVTDSSGNAFFSCESPLPKGGDVVSATATNRATGDASGFSRRRTVDHSGL